MWCKRCRQDVPGTAAAGGRGYCCPRCGDPLRGDAVGPAAEAGGDAGESVSQGVQSEQPGYDSWDWDQQLRHIEWVVSPKKAVGRRCEAAYQQEVARLDPPHAGPPAWHLPPADKPAPVRKANTTLARLALATLTWTVLSLGTMALACGAMLLGWSLVTGRTELWDMGLPAALGGQLALLVGLVLQLDRLGHNSRRAAAKLDDVDEQLHKLETATTMLGNEYTSPAGAFYSHLADGAGPELLLTDLKSQLDLLAVKIGRNDE